MSNTAVHDAAYFNGRFTTRPSRAISVYLFADAEPYNAYCKARTGEPCNTPYGFYRYDERRIVMNVGGTPAAYRSDEPSNVDFSTSHLLEWCMVAGGCAAGPSLEVTERCDSTLTIRFRYEACAGCGTQRLNCVRAIVPREVTEVVAEGIPTACVGAPY